MANCFQRACFMVAVFLATTALLQPGAVRAADEDHVDASRQVERLLKEAGFSYENQSEYFFVVPIKSQTGFVQQVLVTKNAKVFADVPFVEITAIGWQWEDATEFSRSNANWLLKASSNTKIGGWQALVFEEKNAISAEFKATAPLHCDADALAAIVRAVASSAFELHDLMDK